MTSRSRLRASAVPLVAILAVLLLAGTPAAAQRARYSMDPGWRFTLGDPAGAQAPEFDDRAWRRVDLPHDWSIEGTPERNAPGGGRGGYFPTGIGWYRKAFRMPAGSRGHEAWLEFDGDGRTRSGRHFELPMHPPTLRGDAAAGPLAQEERVPAVEPPEVRAFLRRGKLDDAAAPPAGGAHRRGHRVGRCPARVAGPGETGRRSGNGRAGRPLSPGWSARCSGTPYSA